LEQNIVQKYPRSKPTSSIRDRIGEFVNNAHRSASTKGSRLEDDEDPLCKTAARLRPHLLGRREFG